MDAGDVVDAGGDIIDAGGDIIDAGGDIIDAGGDIIDAGGDIIDAGGDIIDAAGDAIDTALILEALSVISENQNDISDNQELLLDYVDPDGDPYNGETIYTEVLDKQDILYEQMKLINDQLNTLIELMSYIFAICCIVIAYYLLHRVVSLFNAA